MHNQSNANTVKEILLTRRRCEEKIQPGKDSKGTVYGPTSHRSQDASLNTEKHLQTFSVVDKRFVNMMEPERKFTHQSYTEPQSILLTMDGGTS